MAAPRGDSREGLNAGFTGFTALEGTRGAQEGFERSHTPGFGLDVDSTSNSLHSGLEPSILSIFEDTSAPGEAKNRIDEESEATLLSALSEILDSVIEDTLSPFDTLPDAELFVGQRNHDSKFRRSSDKEAGPWVSRSQRSSLSNSKVEGLLSDRQLRPRVHHRVKTATVQRSDGEEEELSEIRRCPVRTFRIESDPELSQDEQQDGVLVSLVDLIRHMHPYSLRVDLLKDEKTREVREPQEEDVFVDVVGDDEPEDTLQGISGFSSQSQCDLLSEQRVAAEAPKSKTGLGKQTSVAGQKEKLKMCSSGDGEQNRDDICRLKPQKSILATMGHARVKKKVSFAPDLASVYEYQAECDWSDTPCSEDNKTPDSDSEAVTSDENPIEASTKPPSQHSNAKPKSISLQEYRLLRRKALPKEERKMDYKTKWPSVPEPPRELPPIPCIPGYNPPQVNPRTSFANAKSSPSGSPTKPRRNPHPLSQPKQTAVQAVDPPNPVLVPLPKPAPAPVKTSEEQSIKQQKTAASHPTHLNLQLQPAASQTSGTQEVVSVGGSPVAEVPPPKCSSAIMATTKASISAPSLPMRGRPSQRRLPLVQIPAVIRDHHCAEVLSQKSTDEIGIQATDVTSLLEQFETQGLTPPATPPHQIWKPLVSCHRAKQHEAIKPSSSKAIQIIEPRPLPPSKVHSKPQLFTSVPAPSLSLAFRDHDYCGTQGNKDRSERSFTATDVPRKSLKEPRNHISHKALDHRTFCEEERLPGSVLLSPESSPSRLDESSVGSVEEAGAQRSSRHTSCSPTPTRGRTRRRHYRGRYHHSDSSSSSCSPSCSSSASSSSRSPPRKRRRSRRSSESSTSSSSRSSSSLSPSPVRSRQHFCSRSSRSCSRSCSGSRSRSCSGSRSRSYSRSRSRSYSRSRSRSYSRSRSRSYSRSRSRSRSPESNWRQNWNRLNRERKRKAALRLRKQKAIEERRVVYVGRIRDSMTQDELRDRFAQFGKIEDCTLHFRMHGDNYAFVTYYNKKDAFAAIERGTKLRQPDELPFDICFGGRRQFCQSDYADLDSNRETDSNSEKSRCDTLDFDTLLKQAQRGVKR